MKIFKKLSVILIVTFTSFTIQGLHAQTLEDRYKDMVEEAGDYQDYKVIKRSNLNEFWTYTRDTLNNLTDNIDQLNNELKLVNSEISSLNDQISTQQAEIESLNGQIESMNVLGIAINKSTYVILSFAVLLLLLVVIGFGYITFKEAMRTAKKKSQDYEQLHEDFEEYKRSNLEKQMKLRRELQTERNKLQEVRNR